MDDDCAIEEAARKVAAKPALKKHPLHNAVDGSETPTDAAGEDARKKKGHLKWDEEVIAEHDQLRGTRMKVCVMIRVTLLYLLLDCISRKVRQAIFERIGTAIATLQVTCTFNSARICPKIRHTPHGYATASAHYHAYNNTHLHFVSSFQIDEPNTPFYYDSGAESDGSHQKSPSRKRPTIDFNLLQDRLTDVATTACPPSPSSSHGDSSVDEEKKRQFREHRKKHYNEIDKVRQFRSSNPDSFDDSMDDADDDDGVDAER